MQNFLNSDTIISISLLAGKEVNFGNVFFNTIFKTQTPIAGAINLAIGGVIGLVVGIILSLIMRSKAVAAEKDSDKSET